MISLRDYQDAKADVILKYTTEEARNLKTYGELPENGIMIIFSESLSSYLYNYLQPFLFLLAKINETDTFGQEDGDVDFDIDEVFPLTFFS